MSTEEQPRRPKLRIRQATLDDLPEIMRLEVLCFPSPWPQELFERDLRPGPDRLYLAAEVDGELVGYTGMWFYGGEAHIGTLAVASRWRRKGIGEMLILTLLGEARKRGGRYAMLEYRVGNEAAARLYHKLCFSLVRIRKSYYTDTGEDAAEVGMNDLDTSARIQTLADLAHRWHQTHDYELEIDLPAPPG